MGCLPYGHTLNEAVFEFVSNLEYLKRPTLVAVHVIIPVLRSQGQELEACVGDIVRSYLNKKK